jgi:hypothetical protein
VPDVLARIRIQRDDGGEKQVVAAAGTAFLPVVRVPVARPNIDAIELRVVGASKAADAQSDECMRIVDLSGVCYGDRGGYSRIAAARVSSDPAPSLRQLVANNRATLLAAASKLKIRPRRGQRREKVPNGIASIPQWNAYRLGRRPGRSAQPAGLPIRSICLTTRIAPHCSQRCRTAVHPAL